MPKEYKPGEEVPESGIYKITHDKNHAESDEVTSIAGKEFPPCKDCGHHPKFKLVRAAHHLENHGHFKKK